ncbi:carbonic anhydrase-like protein [Angomonas deanei]|uniref:carbonic anhydrase n=1 Tax=Angomonas deanei TaxID=59799 RepID=A0A7G2CL99_9TRYP|nr:carbonic anhydrase-like protein [Angomonas deanei]CAD2219022.1 Eukaryotic-type carbonic anhydrase, putative [Angomonas deanei]|eukprot:EPY23410.1 carbonic anhydrase-like protein [Angomonas deanei]
MCKTGKRQSPISFANVNPKDVITGNLSRLVFSPQCMFVKDHTTMRIQNTGMVINVTLDKDTAARGDISECTVRDPLDYDMVYHFHDIHFHFGHEHKFRTIKPDVEMHIKFFSDPTTGAERKSLYIAIMLQASSSINSTSVLSLRHMLRDGRLPPPHAQTTCTLTENLSIDSFLPSNENYLAYHGSQTMPPCEENVRWVVFTTPVIIATQGLNKLKEALTESMTSDFHRFGNARPPQPLGDRKIYRFVDTLSTSAPDPKTGELEDVWETAHNTSGTTKKRRSGKKSKTVKKTNTKVDALQRSVGEEEMIPAPTSSTVFRAQPGNGTNAPVPFNATADTGSPVLEENTTTTTTTSPVDTDVNASNESPTADDVSDEAGVESDDDEVEDLSDEADSEDETEDEGESDAEEDESDSLDDEAESTNDNDEETDDQESEDESEDNNDENENENEDNTDEKVGEPDENQKRYSGDNNPRKKDDRRQKDETTKPPSDPKKKKGSKGYDGKKSHVFDSKPGDENSTLPNKFYQVKEQTISYVKENPYRSGGVAAALLLLLCTLLKICCSSPKPAFVVGANPEELQPLNTVQRPQYGTR